jgi:predicted helicase
LVLSIEKWEESVSKYLNSIRENLRRGNYTEHTHRPAFKQFIETICPQVVATNEPKRTECGAPDFLVTKGVSPIGYIEAKDVGFSLDEALKSDQIRRYLVPPSNLILTDYIEFRWFVNGAFRPPIIRIANAKLEISEQGVAELKVLLTNFLNADVRTVKDSKDLANMLANLARTLQTSISSAYEMERDDEELHIQLQSIREILIPDLTPDQFADMISQTITYGLFVSRCYCEDPTDFTREKSAYFIPKTNPFLRKLFTYLVGPDLNIRYSWIVDDIIDLLAKSDVKAILKDFGKTDRKRDPVVHFYETFLSAFDPDLKEKRGVFYTPTPVVDYIVKSMDELLKRDFSIRDGLFDPFVLVLDPACGTGTFLYSLIELIRQNMIGQEGSWRDYISQKLLDRMYGFELLMAPYVIAHLKLNLELQSLGYDFKDEKRLGIYLTNTLEEGLKRSEVLLAKWLSDEANAAAEIKREKPILAVFGNPPYSGHSANKGEWIRKLVYEYRLMDGKDIGEKQIKWLQDDYVKFIRFAQWRIERTGRGIIGFVTNHAYLDNPTFRAMRKNLIDHFNEIYILNLHGNKNRRTITPNGQRDENVFDIRQGVAIGLFVKNREQESPASVYYAELWGNRETKYDYLNSNSVSTTNWVKLDLTSPDFYFVPTDRTLDSEYNQGYSLTEIFPINNVGFVTARDAFAISDDPKELEARIGELRDPSINDEALMKKYKLHDTSSWSLSESRGKIKTR